LFVNLYRSEVNARRLPKMTVASVAAAHIHPIIHFVPRGYLLLPSTPAAPLAELAGTADASSAHNALSIATAS
jgi:hypothetical protein